MSVSGKWWSYLQSISRADPRRSIIRGSAAARAPPAELKSTLSVGLPSFPPPPKRNVRLDDYSHIGSWMCRGSILCRTTSSRESNFSSIAPRTSWVTMGWERRRNQYKCSVVNICRVGKDIRYVTTRSVLRRLLKRKSIMMQAT